MKDALSRRVRFEPPQPEQVTLSLTARDLEIFRLLDRHGKLPSNYLFRLTKHLGRNETFLKKRLAMLYHGTDDGAYLTRHWTQHNSQQFGVYGLTPKAIRALGDKARRHQPTRNDHLRHQLYGATFSASFEAQTGANQFLHGEDIFARRPERKHPFALSAGTGAVIPDDIIGLRTPDGFSRYFLVEIDRQTESQTSSHRKNTIERKFTAYNYVFANGTYADLAIPNATLLFATVSERRVQTALALLERTVEQRFHRKFLFKAFPDFGENWKIPRTFLPVFGNWCSVEGCVVIHKRL